MLSVRSLKKTFKHGTWPRRRESVRVLDGIDFQVCAGEIVGLLGANGAGKTTILHAIAGLLRPDEGWIGFNGSTLDPDAARTLVGLCSSADRSFYYRLTLRENLVFFGRLYGLSGHALRGRIEQLLDLTDLTDFADRQYSRCSTGTRQRLGLARALLHDPEVLLLDEPTRAVDPLHAQILRTFIRTDLAGRCGKTIILATNSLEEAWIVCDRIVLISGGRCIATDTPAGLKQRFTKKSRYQIDLERPDAALTNRLRLLGLIESRNAGTQLIVELSQDAGSFDGLLRELTSGHTRIKAITPDAPAAEDLFAPAVSQ